MENAQWLVTAVEATRSEAAATPLEPAGGSAEAERRFVKAERALRTAIAELDKLRGKLLDVDGRIRLRSVIVIDETTGTLMLIGLEVKA